MFCPLCTMEIIPCILERKENESGVALAIGRPGPSSWLLNNKLWDVWSVSPPLTASASSSFKEGMGPNHPSSAFSQSLPKILTNMYRSWASFLTSLPHGKALPPTTILNLFSFAGSPCLIKSCAGVCSHWFPKSSHKTIMSIEISTWKWQRENHKHSNKYININESINQTLEVF